MYLFTTFRCLICLALIFKFNPTFIDCSPSGTSANFLNYNEIDSNKNIRLTDPFQKNTDQLNVSINELKKINT